MAKYECPRFAIELPESAIDVSSYCFVLTVPEPFHPSIVIKTDRMAAGKSLAEHVKAQMAKMPGQLKNFQVIEEPQAMEGGKGIRTVFMWGQDDARFRQTQMFYQRGERVFTLTATLQAGVRRDYWPELEAVVRTFEPK